MERRLRSAAAMVEARDKLLLTSNVNERTISHRFALYLQRLFPSWEVDCEYNRDHRKPGRPKMLRIPSANVTWDDTDAKTVYPDVIVHRRDSDENLLVCELKKAGLSVTFDRDKLRAYQHELGYKYSCLLVVRTGELNPGFDAPRLNARSNT